MKRTLTTLAAVAAVAMGGVAQADVLRMAYSSAPRSVDPYPFGGATTAGYKEHIYEALVAHDDSPLLATGWTWNSPTSLTVHLREGVKFHNGEPFTARDVVYSSCRMMHKIDGKRNLLTSSMGPLTDVVAVDEHNVRFEMANPYPLWIQKMKFLSILPASGADIPDGPIKYDAEGDCGITAYPTRDDFENGDAAIGTGPFKHVVYEKEFAKMVRNDDYWGEASKWEGVEISSVSNSGARFAGLLAGDYDLIRLHVAESSITLKDGSSFDLKVPSGGQTGIKVFIKPSITVAGGLTAELLLDFDVSRSFVVQGNPNTPAGIKGFIFKPTIKASNLTTSGRLMGMVTDSLGMAIEGATISVFAADTLNTSTLSSASGEYMVLGLAAGSYDISVEYSEYQAVEIKDLEIVAGNATSKDVQLIE